MMKCPRCSFEQPEDVFCASCGVNMQTFKARRAKPKVGIYLIIAAGIGGLVWLTGSLTNTLQNVQKRVAQSGMLDESVESERRPVVERSNNPPPSTPPVQIARPQSPFRVNTNTASQLGAGANTANNPQPQADAQPSTADKMSAAATAPAAERISNQLRVEFALISRDSLNKVNLAQGQASSNLVPRAKYEEVMKDSANQNLASETHSLTAGQTSTIIQGGQLQNKENIGFTMRVAVVKTTDNSADLRIAITRSLPDVAPTGEVKVISNDFSENVTLGGGQVFAISGLLPRKNILPNEASLYSTNVLRALLDPAFQKFDQEFVIFVSPF